MTQVTDIVILKYQTVYLRPQELRWREPWKPSLFTCKLYWHVNLTYRELQRISGNGTLSMAELKKDEFSFFEGGD